MEDKELNELSEVIQSSKINFLIGSGISQPFLPVLNNIEKKLNDAKTKEDKEKCYKEYLKDVMLPNKKVINNELEKDSNYNETIKNYSDFFQSLCSLLLQRKTTILSKQANLFTTNIDVLMETVLEKLQFDYNDGFSGRFTPIFGLENYKKSINQRSLHFDHITEIPVFNIIKIHGSLTWQYNLTMDKIILSQKLENLEDSLLSDVGDDFIKKYQKILVVNPEETKHLESVLIEYYSELLRLYSTELEKENAILFILGFSMDDRHIRQITLRAAKSNPTLRIFVCCSKASEVKMLKKMEIEQNPNIKLLSPEDLSVKFTLDYFTSNILNKVINIKND